MGIFKGKLSPFKKMRLGIVGMIFLNPYKSTVYERILSPSKKKQMGIVGIANPHYDFVMPVFLTPLGMIGDNRFWPKIYAF